MRGYAESLVGSPEPQTATELSIHMKTTPDEIYKAFKGLALAAARVRELADQLGRDKMLKDMPRRQEDSIRQLILEATRDLERTQRIIRGTVVD